MGHLRRDGNNTQERDREVDRILAVETRLTVRQGQVLVSSRVKVWAQNRKVSSSLEDCVGVSMAVLHSFRVGVFFYNFLFFIIF